MIIARINIIKPTGKKQEHANPKPNAMANCPAVPHLGFGLQFRMLNPPFLVCLSISIYPKSILVPKKEISDSIFMLNVKYNHQRISAMNDNLRKLLCNPITYAQRKVCK